METVQEKILRLSRHLSKIGFFAATGGNLALRVDADHMAVTPSAIDYHKMTREQVCIVRINDLVQTSGDATPTVEASLHARVLRLRPDVQCSLHTHQPLASACTLLGKPLTVTDSRLSKELGRSIPLVGYAPSGTGWLAKKLQDAVAPDVNAYLMRNHGVLCCGPDVETTVTRLQDLEAFCRKHLVAQIDARTRQEPGFRAAASRVIAALSNPSFLSRTSLKFRDTQS